uniref:Uncharacterized protein n=1 Tax=Lactuca sativa TaxID=4236 RepID=A0A9R1X867_LACSA|nr:hypothetical protein LSAT_V11C500232870 [Lactuca sativa]
MEKQRFPMCDKFGHFVSQCTERKAKQKETNASKVDDHDPHLFMAQNLNGKIFLNEEGVIPRKFKNKENNNDTWYLDNGTSNHMTCKRRNGSNRNWNSLFW